MKKKTVSYRGLIISGVITIIILCVWMMSQDMVSFPGVLKKLFFPLSRLMLLITFGLAAGQVIEVMGWTKHLSIIARPFFRFSNLGDRCSASFTAAFVSGVAANAILLDFYKEKKITKAQLFLTNYVNQLPAFFLHLPTTFFIVVPLTGVAGVLYFALTFAATLFRTFCFMVFGHYYPPLKAVSKESGSQTKKPPTPGSKGSLLARIKATLPSRISSIAIYVVPIYTAVFVLNASGFFKFLNQSAAHLLTLEFMPVESLSVVVLSFAAEFTSGFAAAGALMDAGVLTTKQTVIALLLGNIIAFPIRALRHQLPRYMGIFSPKMGLQLLLSGQAFRIISLCITGLVYYWVAR